MTLSIIVDAATGQPLLGKVDRGTAMPLTRADINLVLSIIKQGDEAKELCIKLVNANERLETMMGMERLEKLGKLEEVFAALRSDRERLDFILSISMKWKTREIIDAARAEREAERATPINGH